MQKEINTAQKRSDDLDQQLISLEDEKARLIPKINQLDHQAGVLAGQLPRSEAALQIFQDFLEIEPDYQKCRRNLEQVKHNLSSLDHNQQQLSQSLEKLQTEISSDKLLIMELEKQEKKSEQQYLCYKEAPPAENVEGNIEELESRLATIKEDYNREIGYLEQRQKELTTQRRNRQKQLDKLGLAEEDYASAMYDEAIHESIQAEITYLETELKLNRKSETMHPEPKHQLLRCWNPP